MISDPAAPRFAVRPTFATSVQRVGRDQEPVLLIDELLEAPEQLVSFAAEEVAFEPFRSSAGYPGIVAPAPLDYVSTVVKALSPTIERTFGLRHVKLSRAQCRLSIVTTQPQQLTPMQRIPHIDTVDPLQFALLHYLCDATCGGTAFYRHRATGYETLNEQQWTDYEPLRDQELVALDAHASYMTGGSEHYEQIAAVEARFNRLVIYRSRLFHSGIIPADAPLSPEPRKGRLTANIFVNYRHL